MILKNCNSCKIYEPGSETNILMEAIVKCVDDTVTLYFEDRNGLDDQIDRLRVDFLDSTAGCVKTLCKLDIKENTYPFRPEAWTAKCRILEQIEVVQRQKDLRVQLEEEIDFVTTDRKYFTGVIENISVGGFFLTTDTLLVPGDRFKFKHYFVDKPLELQAEILRTVKLDDGRHGYGCQFVRLSNSAERIIRQFVFRQQLK